MRQGPALIRTFDGKGLSIWTCPGTPLLWNRAAACVGLIFDRATGNRRNELPDAGQRAETLIRDCWGAYVHFESPDASHHSVVRDPSGSIPVYYGPAGELDLYASDSAMLRHAWPESFRPHLDAVREWLTRPFLRTRMTGALGVNELPPGALRQVSETGAREHQLWSPASFAGAPATDIGFAEAARLLREEILQTVRLLAGNERVILRLSGGLDSSIVGACLAQAGADVRALTFATRSRDGDERRFARAAADHYGFELGELHEGDLDFSFRPDGDPLRRPPNPLLQPLRRAFVSASTASGGAGVVLDGGGGDNVFGSLNSAAPVVDALLAQGPREAFTTSRDIASLHGCTLWRVARAATKCWRRGSGIGWPEDRSFLLPRSDGEHSDVHPWLAEAKGMLPGSALHLRMIVGAHHFLEDPAPGQPAGLHPLLAQPILELCLRIPSWLWSAGGRDRSVARAAFRGLVPDAILDRRTKGTLESMFVKGYMAKRAELRDLLLSGRLVEEGIVDPASLKAYLDREGQPGDAAYIRVLEIASAEQWLRSFGTRGDLRAP
jgi:asparagine synthase (glutamine-hydrolysing)